MQSAAGHTSQQGDAKREQNNRCPEPGEAGQENQTQNEEQQEGRSEYRAAQVVEHLPAIDHRESQPVPVGLEQPQQELPISADPTPLAHDLDEIILRVVLDHGDVGNQPGAAHQPFQEVVTEHGILRDTLVYAALEGIHIVYAFANVDALPEQVLIGVGDGKSIQVQSGISSEEAREPGAICTSRVNLHARLKNSVAGNNLPGCVIERSPVKRMGQRAGQTECRPTWQDGVCVEGNNETHALQRATFYTHVAGQGGERQVCAAAQEQI
ncbi:MAG: hypothetical protein Q8N39_11285 [Pelolinea sp.]|nr:hypothetical protein [Pelolinea sp.]